MGGNLGDRTVANVGPRCPDGGGHRIALRGASQVQRGLGQVQLRLGEAHMFDRLGGRHGDLQ